VTLDDLPSFVALRLRLLKFTQTERQLLELIPSKKINIR